MVIGVNTEGRWETIEGQICLRSVGSQVFLEIEGDGWYACVTLNKDAAQGIGDWFTVRRLVDP